MISVTTIDRVKELAIEDVVRKYLPDLKKSGANLSAKSPFADEKTASFFVSPVKNIFKCFCTGKGGNGITFIMEKFGCTYPDAVKKLCSDFNIKLDYESNGQTTEHYDKLEELHKVNLATSRAYVQCFKDLKGGHPVVLELAKRKWTIDTITQWQIGYAPGEVRQEYTPQKWNFLAHKIINAGKHACGIELGLIKEKHGVTYDAFRDRIIFPVHNHEDKLVGFGARAMGDQKPKYLNSADSVMFNKSKVLYGLNFAGEAIRKASFAMILEGYADVISFHQAELQNTVGTCGTALTEDQCKLLRKYTNKVVLIYDGDQSGESATLRAIDVLLKFGFQVYTVPMPAIITLKAKTSKAKGKKVSKAKSKKVLALKPVKDIVFIVHRNAEIISIKKDGKEIELHSEDVEAVEKVDPDELARMFYELSEKQE